VGDNPAVLAIDLYNKAYQGGSRPVREVDREFFRVLRRVCLEGVAADAEAICCRAPRRRAGDLTPAVCIRPTVA
jgi:hypothetical protein